MKFGNAESQILKIHLTLVSTKCHQSSILEHFSCPWLTFFPPMITVSWNSVSLLYIWHWVHLEVKGVTKERWTIRCTGRLNLAMPKVKFWSITKPKCPPSVTKVYTTTFFLSMKNLQFILFWGIYKWCLLNFGIWDPLPLVTQPPFLWSVLWTYQLFPGLTGYISWLKF